ncbi:MAG TPA: hypothetical protein VMU43_06025 [Candidatus Acidoferrum sp.]|nr:hypothetical protein [Candidatus Acidoferrum sp.]
MSRRLSVRLIAVVAVLAFLLPLTAGVAAAKDSANIIKTQVQLLNPATLNGTQLQPGVYELKADGSTVSFMQKGKVVAEAPMSWKDGSNKASYTAVIVNNNAVQEIHFSGKTRYVAIAG